MSQAVPYKFQVNPRVSGSSPEGSAKRFKHCLNLFSFMSANLLVHRYPGFYKVHIQLALVLYCYFAPWRAIKIILYQAIRGIGDINTAFFAACL
jgi:hypothetical protein